MCMCTARSCACLTAGTFLQHHQCTVHMRQVLHATNDMVHLTTNMQLITTHNTVTCRCCLQANVITVKRHTSQTNTLHATCSSEECAKVYAQAANAVPATTAHMHAANPSASSMQILPAHKGNMHVC
jgi:hypothetical protein